jgi:hypothetical protein
MNKNHGDKYFLKYSTPSIYIDSISNCSIIWPIKTNDGFPYSSGPNSYWTGYFSSRGNLKSSIRKTSRILAASS